MIERGEQRELPGVEVDRFDLPAAAQIPTLSGWHPYVRYVLVETEEQLEWLVQLLAWAPDGWAWDTETSGLKPELGARVCGHAFCARTGEHELTGAYVPIRHQGPANEDAPQLSPERVSEALAAVFAEGPEVSLFHAKFDRKLARPDGLELRRPHVDVCLSAIIEDENEPSFSLKKLAERYCSPIARSEQKALDDWCKTDARRLGLSFKKHSKVARAKLGLDALTTLTYMQRYGYSRAPIKLAAKYAIHDVFYTWYLNAVRYPKTREQYPEVWRREHAISAHLFEMEWHGLPADERLIRDTHERTRAAVEHWRQECHRLAPGLIDESFEGADPEVRALLFEKLKLPPPKWTKRAGAPAVDKEARRLLAASHPEHEPLINAINELAVVTKLHSTYAGAFLAHYSPQTRSIHPSYNQVERRDRGGVPVTGRLSSSDPNAQNVASAMIHLWDCECETCAREHGLEAAGRENTVSVRRYFTVPEGYVRAYVDFSQIELRMLAWFTQEPALIEAYQQGLDLHQMVADSLGIPRKIAKQVNFGIQYGSTEVALSLRMPGYFEDPDGTRERARVVLDAYHKRYPAVLGFRRATARTILRNGCLYVSPFGRPRRLPGLGARERWIREAEERRMMSSIISGTSADLMKEAMLRTAPLAEAAGGRIVQSIHDEIVFDLPRKPGWDRVVRTIKETMEDWPAFSEDRDGKRGVPILASVELASTRWSEKKGFDPLPDGTWRVAS